MDPAPYTNDSVFDAVMFYQAYRPARGFFAEAEPEYDARQFADQLLFEWGRLDEPFRYGMMNVNATHDSPRLLSCFANKGKYKYRASPHEDTAYISGRPDEDTYNRVRLYLIHQFTSIGSPHIWNGDEFGMWGGDDPDERKPLWWEELKFDDETRTNIKPGKKSYDQVGFNREQLEFYKKLIRIRKENPVLVFGAMDFTVAEDKILAYNRTNTNGDLISVVFNMSDSSRIFRLPENGTYNDLLTGNEFTGTEVTVESLSARLLKRSK